MADSGWSQVKGWLHRNPPEHHTLFCLEFKQCNPSFRTSLSKVTGGVDICMDFWPIHSNKMEMWTVPQAPDKSADISFESVSQLIQNAFTYFFLSPLH